MLALPIQVNFFLLINVLTYARTLSMRNAWHCVRPVHVIWRPIKLSIYTAVCVTSIYTYVYRLYRIFILVCKYVLWHTFIVFRFVSWPASVLRDYDWAESLPTHADQEENIIVQLVVGLEIRTQTDRRIGERTDSDRTIQRRINNNYIISNVMPTSVQCI